jgi:hypothetical protein
VPNQDDVRRLALALPGTSESSEHFAFEVTLKGKPKSFVWVWLERPGPKQPRVPNPGVVAVRVAGWFEKDERLAEDPRVFFTEPHYNGYPAVPVRLERVLVRAWRCVAPRALADSLGPDP